MQTVWDYTRLARYYDKRADYSSKAIDRLMEGIGSPAEKRAADIGAGTGKLTKQLIERGWEVKAVEPNSEMRRFGQANTLGQRVEWLEGTGENTSLPSHSVYLCTFGSSFNVVDREKTLVEVQRILLSGGWFACMWNHRDLEDPTQARVEAIIHNYCRTFDYGARRQDQNEFVTQSGLFKEVHTIEERFMTRISSTDYVDAWRSHATLQRQVGDKFDKVITEIGALFPTETTLTVPYITRIWYAQRAR